jgi:hypothetical protein
MISTYFINMQLLFAYFTAFVTFLRLVDPVQFHGVAKYLSWCLPHEPFLI